VAKQDATQAQPKDYHNGSWRRFGLCVCNQNGAAPTVIARYGNEDAAYISGLHGYDMAPPLRAAMERAILRLFRA